LPCNHVETGEFQHRRPGRLEQGGGCGTGSKKAGQSSRTPKRMITRSVSYSDWLWASRNKTSARRGPGLKAGLYGRLRAERSGLGRLGLRTLAGRILRLAALPARWQARHMYQLATVR
jgi:hypothetical protein